MKVRTTAVIDPLAAGQFDTPASGSRYVGIRLTVTNTGSKVYSDAVSNGSTLVLRGDEQADPTIVGGGQCGNGFGSDVKIAPGDKRVGCIAFEVADGVGVRSFQFTPDSGFSDVTGEWRLPAGASTPALPSEPQATPRERLTACDVNISIKAGVTTCPFAQNVFYEYFVSGASGSLQAYSPATRRTFETHCSRASSDVTCTTDDGGTVVFSQDAVDAYTQDQADAYAATHDLGP